MAKKSKKKDNKNLIIGICSAVVVLVVIIVAVVLATSSRLNDSYFVSDDTKYVLTFENDETAGSEENNYIPMKTHLVYTYEGDDITSLTAYYEYADNATAKAALDYYNGSEATFKEAYVDGNYLVLVANDDDYKGLTASDVKQQLDFMEMLKNANTSEGDVDDEATDGDEGTLDAGETVEVTNEEE